MLVAVQLLFCDKRNVDGKFESTLTNLHQLLQPKSLSSAELGIASGSTEQPQNPALRNGSSENCSKSAAPCNRPGLAACSSRRAIAQRCGALEPRGARECARISLTMERHRLPSQPGLTAAARVVDGAQQRQYCCYGRAWVGAATVVRAPRVGAATVVRAPTEHPPGSSLGEHERLASPPASLGPRAPAPRAPPYAWPYHSSPVRQVRLRNKAAASGEPLSTPQTDLPVPNVVRPARGALGTDGGVRDALKLTRTPPARSRSLPPSPHPGAAMAAAKRSTEITISELTISLSTLESPIESPHALSTPRRVRRVSFGELCLEQRRAMGLTVASGARQMAPDDQMAPDGGEMVSRRECHQIPHASPATKSRSPNPASPLPRDWATNRRLC